MISLSASGPGSHSLPVMVVDGTLARVCRGRGALDVALGERLAEMAVGDRVLRLGWSGIGDYAREVLGVAGRTAQQMVRLARELRGRPLLREAVRRGEVSGRRAVAVLPVAVGEAEAEWVERARRMTVRELEKAVREAGDAVPGGAPAGSEDAWESTSLNVSTETRERFDAAMDLAGRLLGPTSPRWERLEAICQEYLSAHPAGEAEGGDGREGADGAAADGAGCSRLGGTDDEWLDSMKEGLEEEMNRWAFLEKVEPVAAPVGDETDPRRIDVSLRELVAMRDRWDEQVGELGLQVQAGRLWQRLGFASFGHYCEERLGLAARTVEQRVWLERKLHELPELREAMRAGRIGYEKARVIAGQAGQAGRAGQAGGTGQAAPSTSSAAPSTIEALIAQAEGKTCIELRREAEAAEDAQMRARGVIELRMPSRVARLLDEAFRAARMAAGRWIDGGECLFRIADHFVREWEHLLDARSTPARRAVERDRGYCQVPGCSRAAVHAHHVQFRSRGGSNDPENLVGVCAAHHLHGIHRGWIRVTGQAPDGLTWEMGEMGERVKAGETPDTPVVREEEFRYAA